MALASYGRALTLRAEPCRRTQQSRQYPSGIASGSTTRSRVYDRVLSARPDFAEAHSNRGSVLERLERLDEALTSYDRALALRPDYPTALYNRGNVLKALKRHDEGAGEL